MHDPARTCKCLNQCVLTTRTKHSILHQNAAFCCRSLPDFYRKTASRRSEQTLISCRFSLGLVDVDHRHSTESLPGETDPLLPQSNGVLKIIGGGDILVRDVVGTGSAFKPAILPFWSQRASPCSIALAGLERARQPRARAAAGRLDRAVSSSCRGRRHCRSERSRSDRR